MKKFNLIVAVLMMICLIGCRGGDINGKNNITNPTEAPVTTQQVTEAPTDVPVTGVQENDKITMRSAKELVKAMNVGWNLGNTLDSHGAGNKVSAETYWGNVKTSQEIIDAVSAQGFNTIRVPVTWAEHLGPAPDYKIDEKWMDRVQEVVDYCINDNMFVILDTHHETDFWMKVDGDKDALCKELSAIWKQIAERFKDYGDLLIFEGMNEPRTKGSAQEWNGGTYEERKTVDAMNLAFVDAVRSTGGNNSERCLVLCPYGHNSAYSSLTAMTIPEDDGHIIVAVHAYTPYFFTYDAAGGYSDWDSSKGSDIKTMATNLNTKFILAGIPVIVTEFGSVNKNNTQDVVSWITDYMGYMNQYGIKCVWWDNGLYTSNGENFGILNRRTLQWFNQDIADALIANSITDR